uniref:Uncharacterized protein n=1 Tax=Knipowitschia caucasica TaxID=637954 RepID=A0AAV2MPD6_KNICA
MSPPQCKLGALFKPLLPLPHMQEVVVMSRGTEPPRESENQHETGPNPSSLNNGGAPPKEPPQIITKRPLSRDASEDTPDNTGQDCVEMVNMETSGSTLPIPGSGLENQGRAASMPRLNAERNQLRLSPGNHLTTVPDASPMRRSASSVTPHRPQEVNLRDYTLEKPSQDSRTHHRHHHHHCHHRRDRDRDRERDKEKRQRSLDTPVGGHPVAAAAVVPVEARSEPAPRERPHDRGRSHERKHQHSSVDKQRYYSCDRYCSREHCRTSTKSATASCAASPRDEQDTSNKQGSGWVSSSCSSPVRGRRQLPQTPQTPRPGVAYKTAHSSPVAFALSAGRLSRGLSEHGPLRHSGSHHVPCPVTRICSEPFLGGGPAEVSPYRSLREQLNVLPYVELSSRTAQPPPSFPQHRPGVPNGYHLSFGGRTSPRAPRVASYYQEADEDDWC